MLIYSRKTENARLSAQDRDEKQFDYFILLVNPVKSTDAITGNLLVDASVNDVSFDKAVNFTFNSAGGQLFYDLTTANKPEGESPGRPSSPTWRSRAGQRSCLGPIVERADARAWP